MQCTYNHLTTINQPQESGWGQQLVASRFRMSTSTVIRACSPQYVICQLSQVPRPQQTFLKDYSAYRNTVPHALHASEHSKADYWAAGFQIWRSAGQTWQGAWQRARMVVMPERVKRHSERTNDEGLDGATRGLGLVRNVSSEFEGGRC